MSGVVSKGKAAATNPLKVSPALGGAMAFLGMEQTLPLFHGSQGCTAFALVMMVRHFREAIPLQTTAMSELSTILGGSDNVEAAIGNIYARAKPRLVGICSTALTETRGEDMAGDLKLIRPRHPEWDELEVVYASTPDYAGGLAEGWARVVEAVIDQLVRPADGTRALRQVNVLAGSHLTVADLDEIRETIEGFGLCPIILPDLAGSLDGHVPDHHLPTSLGGTLLDAIASMHRSQITIAFGAKMTGAARLLERKTGIASEVIECTGGLDAADRLNAILMRESGNPPPAWVRRDRSRLIDAMLDGHFAFTGRKIAVAAEPDLLAALATVITDLGGTIPVAVTTVEAAALAGLPCGRLIVGDLDDLERHSAGCDILIGPSHLRQAADRTGIPLYRIGFPLFDHIGAAYRPGFGYRGTRSLIFELGNLLADGSHAAGPHSRHSEEDGSHASARAG